MVIKDIHHNPGIQTITVTDEFLGGTGDRMPVSKTVNVSMEQYALLYTFGIRHVFFSFDIISYEIANKDIPGVAGQIDMCKKIQES